MTVPQAKMNVIINFTSFEITNKLQGKLREYGPFK